MLIVYLMAQQLWEHPLVGMGLKEMTHAHRMQYCSWDGMGYLKHIDFIQTQVGIFTKYQIFKYKDNNKWGAIPTFFMLFLYNVSIHRWL